MRDGKLSGVDVILDGEVIDSVEVTEVTIDGKRILFADVIKVPKSAIEIDKAAAAMRAFSEAAAKVRTPRSRKPGKTIIKPGPRLGRNEPCRCGSGKKFKLCCLPLLR